MHSRGSGSPQLCSDTKQAQCPDHKPEELRSDTKCGHCLGGHGATARENQPTHYQPNGTNRPVHHNPAYHTMHSSQFFLPSVPD